MTFIKRLAVGVPCLLLAILHAEGPVVNQSAGPPPTAMQVLFDYSGGNSLIYTGYAVSDQLVASAIAFSTISNASPASFSATGHGFDYQSLATTTPIVNVSGGTGNWAAANGSWIATPTGANTFTIPVDSTGFGAITGTIVVTTRAPLTTKPVWSISKNVYDGSGKFIWNGWAAQAGGAGSASTVAGGVATRFVWADRTTYGYQ